LDRAKYSTSGFLLTSLSKMQVGTIDAVRAQLCTRHGLLLTTGPDFLRAAAHSPLRAWRPARLLGHCDE
jgi:hypothetical protein